MENNDIKPSTIMLMAGGVVLALSTFLEWGEGFFEGMSFEDLQEPAYSAWSVNAMGLFGIVIFLIGVAIAVGTAAKQFGNKTLPEPPMGFNHNQIHLILGLIVLVPTATMLLGGPSGIGLFLAIAASGVIVAASIMDMRSSGAATAPPTQF